MKKYNTARTKKDMVFCGFPLKKGAQVTILSCCDGFCTVEFGEDEIDVVYEADLEKD